MSAKQAIFLCMGSACHQQGVYDVLPALQRLLCDYGFNDDVELKGAFCLGPCTHGVVVRLCDRVFENVRPENVETKFLNEILPCLKTTQPPA